jgi:hypothetical protein
MGDDVSRFFRRGGCLAVRGRGRTALLSRICPGTGQQEYVFTAAPTYTAPTDIRSLLPLERETSYSPRGAKSFRDLEISIRLPAGPGRAFFTDRLKS